MDARFLRVASVFGAGGWTRAFRFT